MKADGVLGRARALRRAQTHDSNTVGFCRGEGPWSGCSAVRHTRQVHDVVRALVGGIPAYVAAACLGPRSIVKKSRSFSCRKKRFMPLRSLAASDLRSYGPQSRASGNFVIQ